MASLSGRVIVLKPLNVTFSLDFSEGICIKDPCLTKTCFTSSKMSHPSIIILSIAKFLRRFSVSETLKTTLANGFCIKQNKTA